MTPMLSVEPVQLSDAWPAPPVALRLLGALGGVVSGIVALASLEGALEVAGRVLGGDLVVVGACERAPRSL